MKQPHFEFCVLNFKLIRSALFCCLLLIAAGCGKDPYTRANEQLLKQQRGQRDRQQRQDAQLQRERLKLRAQQAQKAGKERSAEVFPRIERVPGAQDGEAAGPPENERGAFIAPR